MKTESELRIRANRSTGELEIEGCRSDVTEWWGRVWPILGESLVAPTGNNSSTKRPSAVLESSAEGTLPELFGEFFADFRSDITDVDRILVAAAFVQGKSEDRTFTTKLANQLLLDQNIKVANASQSIRRLVDAKRAFLVTEGRFRVSAAGSDYLGSLKTPAMS